MHIDDWHEAFLSEFNPDTYYESLKKANVQNAMLYFQSHVGLSYYPTRSGKMHAAFIGKEDMMRRLSDKCRQNGIRVTGYYSLIYNNWAHDNHPAWRLVGPDGKSDRAAARTVSPAFGQSAVCRYGLCCPNNASYRQFVEAQIKEISKYFTFDGMFFDMLFWRTPCYCPSCRKRFYEETGKMLPMEDWKNPDWLLHMEKRREWMGEFARFATDTLKKYAPNSSVEHNLASCGEYENLRCSAEEVIQASDYAGGDLYGGPYNQSFICKLYRNTTKNKPFEYMTTRCTPTLAKHTTSKSEDTLQSEVFLTCAHHGASLVIDAIDPVGTLDGRFYEMLGRVFEKEIPYEKYLVGDAVEDIGLYYSFKSKYNADGEPYSNHHSCVQLNKLLIEQNKSFGVTSSLHDLNSYRILIAPMLTETDGKDFSRICDYVRGGGQLYLSGGACGTLLREFFKCEPSGRTEHKIVYISPTPNAMGAFGSFCEKYPLHFDGAAPIMQGIPKEKVIATIQLPYTLQGGLEFASIHSDPPGISTEIPAVAFTEYGKGRVLWSSLAMEGIDNYNHSDVFMGLVNMFFSMENSIISDAPCDVEITEFASPNHIFLSSVLLNDKRFARKVEPFSIAVRSKYTPKEIVCLPSEIPIDFSYENGYARFTVSDMGLFMMYDLRY